MTLGRRTAAAAAALAAAALLALVPATAAYAHGDDTAPAPGNYRTKITAVVPPIDGVTVRAIAGGTELQLTNRGDRAVQVLGYDGEPYLEIRPDGVYENAHSPAAYPDGTSVLETADPAAAPSWRRVSDTPVARWHDRRSHWVATEPPPDVAADPDSAHRIADWRIPLRVGTSAAEITGTLDWLPAVPFWPWWGVTALAAAAVGVLGRWSRSPVSIAVPGVAAVAGGVAALAYAVAREIDAGEAGPGGVLAGLVTGQVWAVLSALAAIAAGGYAIRRRCSEPGGTADFALTLAGACLALFAGLVHTAVFARPVLPVAGDPTWARATIAAVIATGAGAATAAVLRMRAAARRTATAATGSGPPPR